MTEDTPEKPDADLIAGKAGTEPGATALSEGPVLNNPPQLFLPLARALMSRLMADFAAGIAQHDMPALSAAGTSKSDAAAISVWQPGRRLGQHYALGVSRWLLGNTGEGQLQQLRIHIISKTKLNLKASDRRLQAFRHWLGKQFIQYLNEPEIAALATGNYRHGAITLERLSNWLTLRHSFPPLIRTFKAPVGPGDSTLVIGDSVRHCTSSPAGTGTVACFVADKNGRYAVSAAHILSNSAWADQGSDILKVHRAGTMIVGTYDRPHPVLFGHGMVGSDDVATFAMRNSTRSKNKVKLSKVKSLTITSFSDPFGDEANPYSGILIGVGRGQRLYLATAVGIDAIISTIDNDDNVYVQSGLIELERPSVDSIGRAKKFKIPEKIIQENQLSKGGDSGSCLLIPIEASNGGLESSIVATIVAGNERSGSGAQSYAQPINKFFSVNNLSLI